MLRAGYEAMSAAGGGYAVGGADSVGRKQAVVKEQQGLTALVPPLCAGGKLRYLTVKKAAAAPKCGDCHIALPGVRPPFPFSSSCPSPFSRSFLSSRSPPSAPASTLRSRSASRPSSVRTVVPAAPTAFATASSAPSSSRRPRSSRGCVPASLPPCRLARTDRVVVLQVIAQQTKGRK